MGFSIRVRVRVRLGFSIRVRIRVQIWKYLSPRQLAKPPNINFFCYLPISKISLGGLKFIKF